MPTEAKSVEMNLERLGRARPQERCSRAHLPAAADDVYRSAWLALNEDPMRIVLVMDSDGEVRASNETATQCLGEGHRVNGRNLGELYDERCAEERLSLLHRVLVSREPAVLRGMLRGVMTHTTIWPVESTATGELRSALVIISPVHTLIDNGAGTRSMIEQRARRDDLGDLSSLTDRERIVLALIGEGASTAEIAKSMDRSVKTIEWHRASLGRKLRVSNRVELARIAIRAGLLAEQDSGNSVAATDRTSTDDVNAPAAA